MVKSEAEIMTAVVMVAMAAVVTVINCGGGDSSGRRSNMMMIRVVMMTMGMTINTTPTTRCSVETGIKRDGSDDCPASPPPSWQQQEIAAWF
jgi:hypothetical protein